MGGHDGVEALRQTQTDPTATRPPASMERQALRTSVQLQSTNAQTPGKTEKHRRPESKTNQQDTEPCEICKTSIPGSNPGGASKIIRKFALLLARLRPLAISYCSEMTSSSLLVLTIDSRKSLRCYELSGLDFSRGGGSRDLHHDNGEEAVAW